jgi:hypothetical protein
VSETSGADFIGGPWVWAEWAEDDEDDDEPTLILSVPEELDDDLVVRINGRLVEQVRARSGVRKAIWADRQYIYVTGDVVADEMAAWANRWVVENVEGLSDL